jgi:branched-chain amino acid transport system ATP-binding protein
MLELTGASAGYGDATVLHEVSISVRTGTLVALVGANAAGKSTIARLIAGLVPLTQGSLHFDGEDLAPLPAHRRVHRGIVLVPEGRQLFPSLTVEETLVAASSFPRVRAQRDANVERVYALFPRLRERRTQLSATMSGGEQQMLAIGRALMAEPRFLILDEPSLGLAPKVVAQIFEAIEALIAQELTLLLIEQHLKHALAMCDYGYVVENGRIALAGTGAELMADARTREAYLGRSHADVTRERH